MRLNIDRKSLKFKIWVYFVLFAALLMTILWFLQILFLDAYYEEMKISETSKFAESIIDDYQSGDDGEELIEEISEISYRNDMYIHIESSDGTIIFSPSQGDDDHPGLPKNNAYIMEMTVLKSKLLQSEEGSISIMMGGPSHKNNILAYGAYLDDTEGQEVMLFIFSPLFPVESTVDILSNQLKYVTIISLALAFILSFLISNRVSKPIISITSSASKLAAGDYSATFEGGRYSEIVKLADTLNYTSKELAKSDNLHKDLIANVSHDLRTPLTMVKSYAEMIRDLSGDNPVKRNAHLQVIIDEADRLNLLVSDLLVLSKMQSGVDQLNITKFSLKDSIISILNSYHLLCEQEGYQINLNCESDIIATGDEPRIKQVLSNLVSNAVRYSSDEKKITITITETDTVIHCDISDSGQGIPEDELDHIWGRYYKSSSNLSRNTSGTGLGLSIVKEILQLHKADFGVNSKVGEGSTFWFELRK